VYHCSDKARHYCATTTVRLEPQKFLLAYHDEAHRHLCPGTAYVEDYPEEADDQAAVDFKTYGSMTCILICLAAVDAIKLIRLQ